MAENDYSTSQSRDKSKNSDMSGKVNVPVTPSSLSTGKCASSPMSSSTSAMPKRDCGKDSC